VRLLILTHRRADPSFRVRWEAHLPALSAAGATVEVLEVGPRRRALWSRARAAGLVVLHRRLFRALDLRALRRTARRLVYDFDDALYHRPAAPCRSWTRAARFFRTVAAADLVLAGNLHLARVARLRARRVLVFPSTVAVPAEPPPRDPGAPFRVAWIGQRATLPHLEPVLPALRAAGLPVRVIADAAPPGVEHVPWTLEAEERALTACAAGIMPLPATPFARGKCGYKLLRYYAAGLPAVASPVGVNRTLAAGGALLAGSPEAFAEALGRLRDDPGLRAERGARGRDFVRRRYCPAHLGERLVRVLEAAAEAPPR